VFIKRSLCTRCVTPKIVTSFRDSYLQQRLDNTVTCTNVGSGGERRLEHCTRFSKAWTKSACWLFTHWGDNGSHNIKNNIQTYLVYSHSCVIAQFCFENSSVPAHIRLELLNVYFVEYRFNRLCFIRFLN